MIASQTEGIGIGRTETTTGEGHETDTSDGGQGHPTLAANDEDGAENERGNVMETATRTVIDIGDEEGHGMMMASDLGGRSIATTILPTKAVLRQNAAAPFVVAPLCPPRRPPSP